MEQYEEIINLVLKWFASVLEVKINSLEDLDSGQLYLEAINKCEHINIPTEKCDRYEILEKFLDKFYKMKTNVIVDYERITFETILSYEDVISLCVLIFGLCYSLKCTPTTLNQSDYHALLILYKPINNYIKNNVPLDRKSIVDVITKVSEKDLEEFSFSSKIVQSSKSSITDTTQNFTDDQRRNDKRLISDDEMENSFNIQSVTSETPDHRFPNYNVSNSFFNTNSVSDLNNHDGSNDSTRHSRRSKGLVNHRKIVNQPHFASPIYRKYNSPKLTEIRKQDAKRISSLENDIKHYKDCFCELQTQNHKLNSDISNLKDDIKKHQINYRNLTDKNDVLVSQLEENDQLVSKKDKELDKVVNQLSQAKKEKQEKIDEIIQMKNINRELQSKITTLNDKLESRLNDYDEIKQTEIEHVKTNADLKNENKKLRSQLDDYENELQNVKYKVKVTNRDQYIESPVPDSIEEGESMDIINQLKFAEIQKKFNKEIDEYQNEIKMLNDKIDADARNSTDLKSELEVLNDKYREALFEITNYSSKLGEANIIIENNCDARVRLPDIKVMRFQEIAEMLRDFLADNELMCEDRKLLVKFISRELKVDYKDDNDDNTQMEMKNLYRTVTELKESNERKVRENDNLKKQYDDLEDNIQILDDELKSEKDKNEDLTRYCQVQKAKFDDDLFKLKMVFVNVREEKDEWCQKYSDMKREFLKCENTLEKSNAEFNSLREAYDRSLNKLKQLSQDCADYEEVIKEITEQQKKTYRNMPSQTEPRDEFISIGTNAMSPRTPNIINRSNSLRRQVHNRQFKKEPTNQKQSPHVVMSNNIVTNKSLQALRHMDLDRYDNNRGTVSKKTYHSENVFNESPRMAVVKYEEKLLRQNVEQNTYQSQNKWIDKRLKDEKYTKKDSPSVKPERLNQIWSRNEKQPEHLKSSYPVETQGIDVGYMASVYLQSNNIPIDDSDVEPARPTLPSARSSTARNHTNVDPLNFRSDMRNRGLYQYNDNSVMVDDLLKHSGILSARSMNGQRPETAPVFRRPVVPQLKLTHDNSANRDSDCENLRPSYGDREEDRCSVMSAATSVSFNIVNSPKAQYRGVPRGSVVRRDLTRKK